MDSKLILKVEEDNLKLKDFLKEKAEFSSRLTRRVAREGRIKVNGKVARLSLVLNKEDIVEVRLNTDESQNITPEKMDIDIIYEDEDIIVVNKPKNMVVHPTKSHQTGTLTNGLLYYFKETKQNCIVRLVSRLDMNTSGIIVIAKNQFSHMMLSKEMQANRVEKNYMAIIHGKVKNPQGTINLPIYRKEDMSIKRVIDARGQESITHYEVLKDYSKGELLKLTLETGRTHQIRVHLSSLGNPIYGDSLYGKEEDEYITRQALHAYRISFNHPRTKKLVDLEIGLPKDMLELIEKIK